MPLFFINYRDGATLIEDPEGSILPNLGAACREVMMTAREILASKVLAGDVVGGQLFEVMDGNGALMATFPLIDALRRE